MTFATPPLLQNPPHFRHRFGRIRAVVQNTPGVNPVKILIGKIKLLCVTDSQLRRQPERRQTPLRVLNGTLSQINTVKISSGLGVALMVCTQAHANFQNPHSLGTIKAREFQNVRFQFVTLPGLSFVSFPIQSRKIKTLPAGSLVPKVAYLLFIFVHWLFSHCLVCRNRVDIRPAPDFNTQ